MKNFLKWILASPINTALIFFTALIGVVIALDIYYFKGENSNKYLDILVELNGLVFDLFLFGVVIALFNNLTEKQREIHRYKEEIDDYRKWDEKEATFRIVGNIKRLNRLGISKIDLSFCFLRNADLKEVNLENANLFLAQLQGADLNKARLRGANLQAAKLNYADLGEADLRDTNLHFASLNGASLYNADLENASLEKANLEGATLHRLWVDSPYGGFIEVDKNDNPIQRPGEKFTMVRANLKGTNLQSAQILENQRDDIVKSGGSLTGILIIKKRSKRASTHKR